MYKKLISGIMISLIASLMFASSLAYASNSAETINSSLIKIGPFKSEDAQRHQEWIQKKLDSASGQALTLQFAPGEYRITDPKGLHPPDGATLILEGARLMLAESIKSDGQCFLLENVSNVTFRGGEIIGRRDAWDPGTNIAGIRIYGNVSNLNFSDMTFQNLSSNAIGVFGESEESPIRNISLRNVVGINCCNFYGDYLQSTKGPAPGSDRKDQGTVAFYYVNGWLVDGCRFEHSQSDGTHFYHSHNGTFVNSVVVGSQMGGYFLEGCEHVLASGNIVVRNGSRGVTIERDSCFCTLQNNLIAYSGREGLWAPDVIGIIVSSNIFRENGQKDDAQKDCEIRLDNTEQFTTDTSAIQIIGNIFQTNQHQTAAIYYGKGIKEVTIEHNQFLGPAPKRFSED